MVRPDDVARELRALADRYAAAADDRDADAFADVFTDDGVLETHRGEMRGRDELRSVPERLARYDQTRHTVTSHEVVDVAGDAATARAWCTAEHTTIGDVCVETYVMEIRYDDRCHRDESGRWRIAHRRLVLLSEDTRQGA